MIEADPSGDADRLWRESSQVPQYISVPWVASHLGAEGMSRYAILYAT